MNRIDDYVQDPVPTQKLEWVTPKISLMDAGDTEVKVQAPANENTSAGFTFQAGVS